MDAPVIQYFVGNLPNLHLAPFRASQLFRVERKTVGTHCKIVKSGNVKTHRLVAVTVSCRLDYFAVIIHPAEHDVTMRMRLVSMPDDYIRSVGYSHLIHIFLSDF